MPPAAFEYKRFAPRFDDSLRLERGAARFFFAGRAFRRLLRGHVTRRSAMMHGVEQKATARVTGIFYLLLALSGGIGFLLVRPAIYVPGDAAQTAKNLVEHASLARLGVALELGTVLWQALAAIWFFRLFRSVDPLSAAATAAFGLVNSVAILVSAAFFAVASDIGRDVVIDRAGDPAATAHLLLQLSGACWRVGGIFFGLWLLPMGYAARRSKVMPRILGAILIAGGLGYVIGTFADVLGAPRAVVDVLPLPATVGEFWMIGYLLIMGWKEPAPKAA